MVTLVSFRRVLLMARADSPFNCRVVRARSYGRKPQFWADPARTDRQ